MALNIINNLIAVRKGPCLTVIIPWNRPMERTLNKDVMRKMVTKAKNSLKKKAISETDFILQRLEKLLLQVTFTRTDQGVGIFISPEATEVINFPFSVKEKTILNDSSFDTRDLLYLRQFYYPYYTLLISKKEIHLFHSQEKEAHEIKDGNFPMKYMEEYEYARPALGTSFGYARKGFEKDKSLINRNRIQSFYREAISHLEPFIDKENATLVVAGTKNQVSLFASLNNIDKKISAKVFGSFDKSPFQEKVWDGVCKFRKKELNSIISTFKTKDPLKQVAKGIQEVWLATHEGKGRILLVEKDYKVIAYLRDGDPTLYLRAPKGKYITLLDAVDEIIETVIDKGGKVLFTEEKQLRYFDFIALGLRY